MGGRQRRLRDHGGQIEFVGSFSEAWPSLDLPEVAFAGRSNVGKSSALNTLLDSRKAARVSSRPGRTQAINLFRLSTGCVCADLPGYGYARVPDHVQDRWKETIERYLAERDTLRLVVALVDARRTPQDMDGQLIGSLREFGVPTLVVATKVDKLKRRERDQHLTSLRAAFYLDDGDPIAFSAITREGRDAVWDRIEAACR